MLLQRAASGYANAFGTEHPETQRFQRWDILHGSLVSQVWCPSDFTYIIKYIYIYIVTRGWFKTVHFEEGENKKERDDRKKNNKISRIFS